MPDVLTAVAQVLDGPPPVLLHAHLRPEVLTTSGNLPGLAVPSVSRPYGIIFSAFIVPPQLGRTGGLRPVYTLPLLKAYKLVQLTSGGSIVTDAFELHETEETWRFNGLDAISIEYQVLPGCSIAWSYLTLFP